MVTEKDEGELEFATKEDLELIEKSPELKKVYAAMKAGVTKKFQSRSEEVKKLNEQLQAYDTSLSEWEQWGESVKPILADFESQGSTTQRRTNDDDRGNRDFRADTRTRRQAEAENKQITHLVQTVEKMNEAFTKAAQDYDNRLNQVNRMFDLSMQLNDLYRLDPEIDGNKVLEATLKEGLPTLRDGYNRVYHEKLVKKEVDPLVEKRVQEEMAKRQIPAETGSGTSGLGFEMPKEPPKSWADASQGAMAVLKEERASKDAGTK
jgi:hypothetical protein